MFSSLLTLALLFVLLVPGLFLAYKKAGFEWEISLKCVV